MISLLSSLFASLNLLELLLATLAFAVAEKRAKLTPKDLAVQGQQQIRRKLFHRGEKQEAKVGMR